MATDPQYHSARQASETKAFREDLLSVLSRIAVALENSQREVGSMELEYPEPGRVGRRGQGRIEQVPAETCTCGGDPQKACTECSPARIAWVYHQRSQ